MRRNFAIALTLAVVCGGILLITGCSSANGHKWLTFFFDGVPAETAGKPAALPLGTNAGPAKVAVVSAKPSPTKPPSVVVHLPFSQNKCGECHERNTISSGTKLPLLQLCFNCHSNFLTGIKVKHQPVGDGACMDCHAPHQSPNQYLLIKKGKDLCLSCHDDPLAAGKIKHQPVETGACLDCHGSHATNFKGLLKKSVKDTCADCHENIAPKNAKVVHQPVGDGDCLECHTPHASKFKGLLKKSVKDTCASCHDDIPAKNAKDVHQPVGDGDCLACHNPHATDKKALVKKSTPALCWDCHDNFLEKAKFKHDVVEDCSACHRSHQSVEPNLLVKNILKLCSDCHDDKELKAVKAHAGTESKSCVACHDPHVGGNANLLKPAAVPK